MEQKAPQLKLIKGSKVEYNRYRIWARIMLFLVCILLSSALWRFE